MAHRVLHLHAMLVCCLLQKTTAVPTFTRPTLTVTNSDTITHTPGQVTHDVSVVIETENTGFATYDELPAAAGGENNFDLVWYFSANETLETQSDAAVNAVSFTTIAASDELSSAVDGEERLRIEGAVSLEIPDVDPCNTDGYLCLRLPLTSTALRIGSVYEETDGDYRCIPFGNEVNTTAGEFVCPAVLGTPTLSIASVNNGPYRAGEELELTVTLSIRNIDSHALQPASAPSANFEDGWWFSKDDVLVDGDSEVDASASLTPTSEATLASRIAAQGTLIVTGSVTLTVPVQRWEDYHYLCVRLSIQSGVGAFYGSGQSDYTCVSLPDGIGPADEEMPDNKKDSRGRAGSTAMTTDKILPYLCSLIVLVM
ncbi:uncharacterized protein [Ptychodera flava]|uniref:uncharacterized protein n=1 Tax=Ptychodera flava TaxID=63121 RepID=UPI00396A4071